MIIAGIFPFCFTPELYAAKPDYIGQLAAFVRSRPKQPLDAFIRQSNAVIAHDALGQLGKISAPTQITFGRHDIVTSPRFAEPFKRNQEHGTRRVRGLRPRSDLRKRERVQRKNARVPQPARGLRAASRAPI